MLLRIKEIKFLADGINAYKLVDPKGGELPAFQPGAHVALNLGGGIIRQYSLCGDQSDFLSYTICVLREENGRGGSKYIHDNFRTGEIIETSEPRNNFHLVPAIRYLFIAGGIGITPIMPMLRSVRNNSGVFRLYYCTRTAECTAFREELLSANNDGSVVVHHDNGDPVRRLDVKTLLETYDPGIHLYYCGPPGFMDAIGTACSHWPTASVHYEYFSASSKNAKEDTRPNLPFRIRIADTGSEFDVPATETIVSVLRRNGISVDTSCESGYCGTCMTRYTAGEPDHRDTVLDAESRKSYMLICCSRSKTPCLELDI